MGWLQQEQHAASMTRMASQGSSSLGDGQGLLEPCSSLGSVDSQPDSPDALSHEVISAGPRAVWLCMSVFGLGA
jgi:hypothetical protein